MPFVRLAGAWTFERILLMPDIKKIDHRRPMTGEYRHSSFQNSGPLNGRQSRQRCSSKWALRPWINSVMHEDDLSQYNCVGCAFRKTAVRPQRQQVLTEELTDSIFRIEKQINIWNIKIVVFWRMTSCDLVTSEQIEISNRLYTIQRAPEDAATFPTCVLASMYLSVPGATETELVGVPLRPGSLYEYQPWVLPNLRARGKEAGTGS
jgi:hypothetical protein